MMGPWAEGEVTTASQQLPLACLEARCCLVWPLGRAGCKHQLMCRRQHRLGSRFFQNPERRLNDQWPSVAVACLQARLVCSGIAWQYPHCICSGMHAATTRRWAGGNTVNAAPPASAEKRLRGSDVDFAAECESWEGSRSNGFFRSVPSGNSFIMQ